MSGRNKQENFTVSNENAPTPCRMALRQQPTIVLLIRKQARSVLLLCSGFFSFSLSIHVRDGVNTIGFRGKASSKGKKTVLIDTVTEHNLMGRTDIAEHPFLPATPGSRLPTPWA